MPANDENVLKPLAKKISLGLTAAASPADAGIISNEEMRDITKIVKSLKDSHLLMKGITQTIENETKEQRVGFLRVIMYSKRKPNGKYVNRKMSDPN